MNVMGLSLVMDGEWPVIAYKDANDGFQTTVKLARMAYPLGLEYGNCGPENPFSTWYCQTIDQGLYGLGNDIDLAISAGGMLRIAFLEADDGAQEEHVWVAQEVGKTMMPVILK